MRKHKAKILEERPIHSDLAEEIGKAIKCHVPVPSLASAKKVAGYDWTPIKSSRLEELDRLRRVESLAADLSEVVDSILSHITALAQELRLELGALNRGLGVNWTSSDRLKRLSEGYISEEDKAR